MKTQAYCRTWSSLHHASLPLKFWDFAFCTAVYLINRLPTTSLNFLVTYHMLFQQFPDYTFLKTFGCACFPLLRPYNNHKVDFRSAECLFLGYSTSHKGYKCMSSSGRIYISKDVIFNESKFPYADLFETFTSLGQSTSSSIPFQFHSIPIIQSPNLSHPTSNSPQTHTSYVSSHLNSPDVGQSASVSAQSSSNHQPVQSDTDIPIPASSSASSPVQSPSTEPTNQYKK